MDGQYDRSNPEYPQVRPLGTPVSRIVEQVQISKEANKIMITVMLISCLTWKTINGEYCYDVNGKPVPLGSVYFDGDSWGTCRFSNGYDQRQTMVMMEEKWKTLFKLFDFNHDGLITQDDFEIHKNSFIKLFKLNGADADNARSMLDKFWYCVLMYNYGSRPVISEYEFLDSYKTIYTSDKAGAIEKMKKCDDYLLTVVDNNRDGFVSIGELFIDSKAWFEGNEQLVQGVFNMMGPNDENLVPNENFAIFLAEMTFGENNIYFSFVKKLFEAKVLSE